MTITTPNHIFRPINPSAVASISSNWKVYGARTVGRIVTIAQGPAVLSLERKREA